ncbi:hypothetical protein MKEN_00032700 [Mycena kentingensis (nom. inval.)]|nr:hypothetical protein MKEN_00032700 [Mycena kentingensis (nom. inval.)]
MPFVDDPLPPASTHVVQLHASFHGLGVSAYLALIFIILAALGVVAYMAYNAHHKLTLNDNIAIAPAPPAKQPTSTRRKYPWRLRLRAADSESDTQCLVEQKSAVHPSSPTQVPLAVPLPLRHREGHYDAHNIRFASPSANLAVFNNPKLAPVAGPASLVPMPLSYFLAPPVAVQHAPVPPAPLPFARRTSTRRPRFYRVQVHRH